MVPCFFIAHGAPNRHPNVKRKKHTVPIRTLHRTQRTPEPSGPSASPPAQTIAHIVVSVTVAVACPDSVGGSSNSPRGIILRRIDSQNDPRRRPLPCVPVADSSGAACNYCTNGTNRQCNSVSGARGGDYTGVRGRSSTHQFWTNLSMQIVIDNR